MLLRDKDKEALKAIFREVAIPIEVWAYGSRINGNAHSGSDLDLVVRTPQLMPMDMDDYSALCQKITNSNIPILVDLRDWALLPTSFHQNIEANYEVLFSSIGNMSDNSQK